MRPDWLLNQLPVGMLEDAFFTNFVRIFQEQATTYLDEIDSLEHMIDLTVAPDAMVRYLGRWIGVQNIDARLPHEEQRRFVRESGEILAWRGTKRGLTKLLELISGGPVVVEETGGIYREHDAPHNPQRVRIQVQSTGWTTEADFLELIQAEIPASVSFEARVGDRVIWPAEPEVIAAEAGKH